MVSIPHFVNVVYLIDWFADTEQFLLPRWLSGKEFVGQCRRHRLDPWVGKILCYGKWQPAPVFLPGKSHGQRRSLLGYTHWVAKSQTHRENKHACMNNPCIPRKKLQSNILDEHRYQNPQQNISKLNSKYIRRIIQHDQWDFFLGMQGLFTHACLFSRCVWLFVTQWV